MALRTSIKSRQARIRMEGNLYTLISAAYLTVSHRITNTLELNSRVRSFQLELPTHLKAHIGPYRVGYKSYKYSLPTPTNIYYFLLFHYYLSHYYIYIFISWTSNSLYILYLHTPTHFSHTTSTLTFYYYLLKLI